MCEVNKSNFNDIYPSIEKSLKKAAFIAIDSEFSGLVSHSKLKNSLFDSSADRYLKLKCSIEQFTIFQFGLAIFHYSRDINTYVADVYSFYTFPCSFGPVDNRFLCQASSWEFLRVHNFNFNKVAYEGIPFLSSVQESLIRSELSAGSLLADVERSLPYREEDELQTACSRVAQWLPTAAPTDTLEIDVGETEYCLKYFLHKELRSRFKGHLWTFSDPKKVRVQKLSVEAIHKISNDEGDHLDETLLDCLLGFSKIFKLLVALKKPLIGHNLLLDLMILYNQMFKPLPNTYAAFKKQLNILFPSIYDTKFISYQVKNILKKQDCWSSNRLDNLYIYFNSHKGKTLASFSPIIQVESESTQIENVETHLHEAAWDAYMSGYCFIRLAHFLAIRRLGEGALPRPLSRVEHLSAVAEYCNCVNMIRGNVSHMNIGGEEPKSNRPKLLYMTRHDKKSINIDKVTALMASYGSVDVKAHSYSSALIAVSNLASARDIVRAFAKHNEYKVVPYSYLRHNSYFNTALWSGLICSGAFCIAAVITSSIARK